MLNGSHTVIGVSNDLCPICGESVLGTNTDLQTHVNRHLDEAENENSMNVANQIQQQQPVAQNTECVMVTPNYVPTPIGVSSIQDSHAQLDKSREQQTLAESVTRETEEQDAALAAALAQETKVPSLTRPLSDTAEYVQSDILSRLLTLFDSPHPFFKAPAPVSRRRAHFSSTLDLYSSNLAGLGWDCGYRNTQMLFSALLYNQTLGTLLAQNGLKEVPSIPEIAGLIEEAWRNGYDREGASNFGGKLIDREVWIGATEVQILFRSLQLNALVMDFETQTLKQREVMFQWVYDQFERWCGRRNCPLHANTWRNKGRVPFVAPMFCQWQGHSVTIIGAIRSATDDVSLLILDPSRGFYESVSRSYPLNFDLFKREATHHQMQQPRFQLVYIPNATVGSKSSTSNVGVDNDPHDISNINVPAQGNHVNNENGDRNGKRRLLRPFRRKGE